MKSKPWCVILCLAIAVVGHAQPPAPSPGADADFAAFEAAFNAPPKTDPKTEGQEKAIRAFDVFLQELSRMAFAFYDAHPTDPRRWEVVLRGTDFPPFFAKGFGPDVETKGAASVVVDEQAKTAWRAKLDAVRAALLAADDVPAPQRERVEWEEYFGKNFRATSQAKLAGRSYDYEPFKARFAAHVAKFSGQPMLPERAADYLGALEDMMPGQGVAGWKELTNSPEQSVRERAAQELSKFERRSTLKEKPLELAFTAADGREVDLAKLRGKVVLVDFWATWCGPCVAEIPNVVATYRKYHDQGFEVVGVTLENPNVRPNDTPEQKAAKLEAAKKKMLQFAVEKGMPWPQYFDGKWWKNDHALRFGVDSIPAMFLLDQYGKVVSTDARGEKLESEVKRLLKL